MPADAIDSNVLLYMVSAEVGKGQLAETLLRQGPTLSVQVLNEVTNVCLRKRTLSWEETHEFLEVIRDYATIVPLTVEVHETGLFIAERYKLALYDAMIVGAALEAGCGTLWSEDMHDGLLIEGRLSIRNPFAPI
jgi:predicted nucleic acid-binding protein